MDLEILRQNCKSLTVKLRRNIGEATGVDVVACR